MPGEADRFVAICLRKEFLSDKAAALLDAGRKMYRLYFARLHKLRTAHFKIHTWDAGWWQIRNAMAKANLGEDLIEEVKRLHALLKEKLEPQIYSLGFLG